MKQTLRIASREPQPAPPTNVEAESLLVGALLADPEALCEVSDLVRPQDFSSAALGAIYGAMITLFERGEPVELIGLIDHLARQGCLEMVGGADALIECMGLVASAQRAKTFARSIREASDLRRIIASAAEITRQCHRSESGAIELAGSMIEELNRIVTVREDTMVPASRLCRERLVPKLDAIQHGHGGPTGILSGFGELDKLTCGFQPTDLIVLAARPSVGKTALALNLSRRAALDGVPVGFFSLEMGRDQLIDRLACMDARVDGQRYRRQDVPRDQLASIYTSAARIAEWPLYIDDTPGLSILDLKSRLKRAVKRFGLKLVIVDYLQLMSGERGEGASREQEISSISRGLKGIAKELQVPVIALSQLNRKVEERADKRPQLSDLRESGAIEQDADLILFLYRESVYTREEVSPDPAELIVAKQRNGPTGVAALWYEPGTTRFTTPQTQRFQRKEQSP